MVAESMDNTALLVQMLRERGLWLATAESCTGGLIAAAITAVPGSSACFGYGVVSYSNQAKEQVLGVPAETLERYGAVSEETARAMAEGILRLSGADLGLSVTGIAGPGGATPQKPVGLVYLALATAEGVRVERHLFPGDRQQVRAATLVTGLHMVEQSLGMDGEVEGKR